MDFYFFKTDGISGLRMVIFSLALLIVILFFQRGLMGNRELSWDMILNPLKNRKKGVKEE